MTLVSLRAIVLLAVPLLTAGCFSLQREPPRKHLYVLDAGNPAGLSPAAEPMVLRVRPARIAPP